MAVALYDHCVWLRLRGLSPDTIKQRQYVIRRLGRALGHDPVGATVAELDLWQRNRTLTAAGMSCELAHISSFYRWCVDEGLMSVNPAARLPRPKRPKRVPRPIADEKLERAVKFAPSDIRLMLVLAAYCGMRAGELARLQRGDLLETNAKPVVIVNGKGGRQRAVPLSSKVVRELHRYRPPSRGALFPRHDGKAGGITPSRLSQMVNRYLHGLGIPDTLHSARHWAGTHIYEHSKDLRLTQEILGHNDPATTAGYVQFSHARAFEAMEQVGDDLDDTVPLRVIGDRPA